VHVLVHALVFVIVPVHVHVLVPVPVPVPVLVLVFVFAFVFSLLRLYEEPLGTAIRNAQVDMNLRNPLGTAIRNAQVGKEIDMEMRNPWGRRYVTPNGNRNGYEKKKPPGDGGT